MSAILLTANLTQKVANLGSGAWTPPALTFGEDLTLALRFAQEVAGVTIEPDLDIRAVKALIGFEDARPLSGTWALQIGPDPATADNTTDTLQHDCSPSALQTEINLLGDVTAAYGVATVTKVDGSFVIVFASATAAVTLKIRENELFPSTLARVAAEEIDSAWVHDLRLVQVPVAITTVGPLILPNAPSISVVTEGGSGGGYEWNEVQKLTIPPDFRASYVLAYGYARTVRLTLADGVEQIQAALIDALGAASVTVTDGNTGEALIEFVGDLAGTDVDALTVTALDPPPGDLTFTLALDKAPLYKWLRAQRAVTLPLEFWLTTADADEVLTKALAFRLDVTIQRSVDFDELDEIVETEWLRPLSPTDYVPVSTSTVLTADKSQRFLRGDGSFTTFVLAHSFAAADVGLIAIDNITGRQMTSPADYTVPSRVSGSITVVMAVAPAVNGVVFLVLAYQAIAAFADGLTVTIGQVTGLDDRLTAIESSLAVILALIPSTPVGSSGETSTDEDVIEIDGFEEAFPSIHSLRGASVNLATLPRPGYLLPAAHDASASSVSSLPGSPAVGDVIVTTAALTIPGGGGTRSSTIAIEEFAAWDGRRWYPVSEGSSTSTSYFPRDFERTLLRRVLRSAMLRAGRTATLDFRLDYQIINGNSTAQYWLAIEHGVLPSQGAPLATAINITTAGTGTHSLIRNGVTLGTFTVNTGTDVATITGTVPASEDVVSVSSSTTLPAPLAAATNYVIRDLSGSTFKFAAFTDSPNLLNVQWNATPMLLTPIYLDTGLMPIRAGVEIIRSSGGVLSANKVIDGFATAADSVPTLPDVALRARLIDFDTENSVSNAKGTVFLKLSNATLKLT